MAAKSLVPNLMSLDHSLTRNEALMLATVVSAVAIDIDFLIKHSGKLANKMFAKDELAFAGADIRAFEKYKDGPSADGAASASQTQDAAKKLRKASSLNQKAFKGKNDRASADSGVEAPRANGRDDLPESKIDSSQGKVSQGYVDLEDPNTPLLRKAYIIDVHKIADEVKIMRDAGKSSEEIAWHVHKLRRDIGERYKDLTPPDLLEKIYQDNLRVNSDKLGPSIELLRSRGKSWEDIIDSATRAGNRFNEINKKD